MPLILRAVKGSKLTIVEMDGNLTYLVSTLSGSIIQVTGSSMSAPNTSITASSFSGNGSQLTSVTASFITASNVYGPYGASSVLSSSYALTSSYAATASYSRTLVASFINEANGNLKYLNSANAAIDSFFITASTSLTSSLALTASYITSSRVQGPSGFNSILSASYAISSSYAVSASHAVTASYALNSSAGGSNTQMQFNNNGVLGGDSDFTYNLSLHSLQHGSSTLVSNQYSIASGLLTTASGYSSVAIGAYSVASGTGAFAAGFKTIALGNYQTVVGSRNDLNNSSSIFVVGGGSEAGGVYKDAFSVEADFTQYPNPAHIVIPANNALIPGNPKTGSMYYDTSTNKLWIWNGVWRSSSFGI